MDTRPRPSFEDAVARIKREILRDISGGIVSGDVKSFSALHDYVDANEYGGFSCDSSSESDMDFMNVVRAEIDEWLKAGRR